MAVTKTLTKAVPAEKNSKVEEWALEMTYENDSEGDATYYTSSFSEHIVASYTDEKGIQTGKKFAEIGFQVAAGVPLQCDEPEDYQSFRLGLFGLDKLHNVGRTVEKIEGALIQIIEKKE